MPEAINILVDTPKQELIISGYPQGVAFNVNATNQEFVVPTPTTTVFEASSGIVEYDLTVDGTPSAEAISAAGSVNITLGTLPANDLYETRSSFKHLYKNFVDSGTSSFVQGDVVVLKSNLADSANDWKATCIKADTANEEAGAFSALHIFISHTNNDLILVSQGYFDVPDSKVTQWTAGRTLYLDNLNKFNIVPSQIVSGGWVRSLGYSVPNTDSKKRIWFQPDSTFVKII
jgi:hypothetical protein